MKIKCYIWRLTVCLFYFLTSCEEGGKYEKTFSEREVQVIDSIVYANRCIDSLRVLATRFAQDGNTFGEIVAYNELGKCYREESRFSEAIETHKKGLMLSVSLCDTLQIIQALNNIGTNYRRIGFLDEASSYHYKALSYCEAYSHKNDKKLLKSRVISLNGIGNVFLTLNNYEVADSVFRMALDGEQILGSSLGQAINYANIGAIFESKGQIDSAKHYYQFSMKFNQKAHSELGISLCHTHFGRLYEKNGELDKAIDEYRKAYNIMQFNSDTWHWIESCLSLARVYIQKGDFRTAGVYFDQAQKKAVEIHSLEHLAEIYHLEYLWYLKKGDSRKALDCLVKSREYHDSVHNEKKMMHVQNTHILYERKSKQNEISTWQENYKSEKMYSKRVTVASILVMVLACILLFSMWLIIRFRSQKNQMLKQMEQMRINFFTNITHEFRTPLTIIQSAAYDVLCRKPEDENIKRDIKDILHHKDRLLNLINQILDIAKMTSPTHTAQPDIVRGDVVEFIYMICDSYVTYAANKGIRLVYKPQQERVEKLLEQRQLLRQKYSQVIETEDNTSDNTEPVLSERDKIFVAKLTDSLHCMMEKGKIDYDALAYNLCISRAQLNRKLKAITGFTTTEYILQVRIALAKHLLDTTDLPIWEVAEKCGMDNATYFGIIFKKKVGMTPLHYKKRDKNTL